MEMRTLLAAIAFFILVAGMANAGIVCSEYEGAGRVCTSTSDGGCDCDWTGIPAKTYSRAPGSIEWVNGESNYACWPNDNSRYCYTETMLSEATSESLDPSRFNFDLPKNAIVKGVKLAIWKNASADGVKDNVVGLMKSPWIPDDVPLANDASTSNWSLVEAQSDYGGEAYTWGHPDPTTETLLKNLRKFKEDINSYAWGARISVNNGGGSAVAAINNISMTVYYRIFGINVTRPTVTISGGGIAQLNTEYLNCTPDVVIYGATGINALSGTSPTYVVTWHSSHTRNTWKGEILYNNRVSSNTDRTQFDTGEQFWCTVTAEIEYGPDTISDEVESANRITIGGGGNRPSTTKPTLVINGDPYNATSQRYEVSTDEPLLGCQQGTLGPNTDGVRVSWKRKPPANSWDTAVLLNNRFFASGWMTTDFDAGETFYCEATPYKDYGSFEDPGAANQSEDVMILPGKRYNFTVSPPPILPSPVYTNTPNITCDAPVVTNTYPNYTTGFIPDYFGYWITTSVGPHKSTSYRLKYRTNNGAWWPIDNGKSPLTLYNSEISGINSLPYDSFDLGKKYRCYVEWQMQYGYGGKDVDSDNINYTEVTVRSSPPIPGTPVLAFSTPAGGAGSTDKAYRYSTLRTVGIVSVGWDPGVQGRRVGYEWYRNNTVSSQLIDTSGFYSQDYGSPDSFGTYGGCWTNENCTKGYDISVRAVACDSDWCGYGNFSNRIFIHNTPPYKPTPPPAISPSSGNKSTVFTVPAYSSYEDVEGDTVTFNYTWYTNNSGTVTLDQNSPSASYNCATRANCIVGTNLTMKVAAFDGTEIVYSDSSAPARVTAFPPRYPPVPKKPAVSPTKGPKNTIFSSTPGNATDAENDPINYTYVWYVLDTGTGITYIDQNNNSTAYDCGARANCVPGARLSVRVNASDIDGWMLSNESSKAKINIPPYPPSQPNITPSPNGSKGTIFTSSQGIARDLENDPTDYRYLWYINNSGTALLDQNSTSRNYSCTTRANCTIGSNLTVVVIANDTDGVSLPSAPSDKVLIIPRQPPGKPDTPTIAPPSGYKNSTYTSSPGNAFELEAEPVTYTYIWNVTNGSISIEDQNSASSAYDCTLHPNCKVGLNLTVVVRGNDSDGTGPDSNPSDPVAIGSLYYTCPLPQQCGFGCVTGMCGSTPYNPSSYVCCGTDLYPKSSYTGCCGTTPYNSATQGACCNGIIHSGADACCGTMGGYNTATAKCCSLAVSDPPKGADSFWFCSISQMCGDTAGACDEISIN